MRARPIRAAAIAAGLTLAGTPIRPLAAQETHALVIVGLGGTDSYRRLFIEYATELHDAFVQRDGIPDDHVTVLAERADLAPAVVRGRSTKENVVHAIGEIAARAAPGDRVLIVLIGHGTAQGDEGRFNLPGPDLSAEELAAALAAFPTQTMAVVHTGSAGGGFIEPLSGPNRIVVSATRTVRERNATEFPRYFVEALAGDGADMDKDGGVSLLEAFVYARAEVARHYEEENELLVEHAVLDDDGDGAGSPDPGANGTDGRLAATFRLGGAVAAAPVVADSALARLYDERRGIMLRIDGLRAAKDTTAEEAYDDALEALLVELALKNRAIKAREGGGGT